MARRTVAAAMVVVVAVRGVELEVPTDCNRRRKCVVSVRMMERRQRDL